MTNILHGVKGGLLWYCNKEYSCGNINQKHRIGGVMVSVLASSAVDRGFEPRSGQTKDYAIGVCYFSAKHVALRRKSKDWLTRNQNNVSEWSDISTHGLLFQWASTIKIQLSVLV
jgi:predicted LPLAT superfamily acyltransferase